LAIGRAKEKRWQAGWHCASAGGWWLVDGGWWVAREIR